MILKHCDNLEFLQELKDNSIDLIYCDILYGTGRKFNDYKDLKPIRKDIEEHYTPRLIQMHRVLKNTGSIYLQMDTRINHWIRIIMDNIFGYDNFRNELSWCYRSAGFSKNKYSQKHDVILFYTKSDKYTFNLIRENEIPESVIKRFGNEINKTGTYKTIKNEKEYTINPYSLPKDWFIINSLPQAHNERVGYDTQKPKALIEKLIKISSNENDLVADFYLGSGTTAVVCSELKRQFVGCDINLKSIEITKNRLEDLQLKLF